MEHYFVILFWDVDVDINRTITILFSLRLQPNSETRKKQLTAWCDLVLAYHKHHRLYSLDVKESQSSPLFCNAKANSILCNKWSIMYLMILMVNHVRSDFNDLIYCQAVTL